MNTTATMTPSAITGRKSFSVAPPLIHAVTPDGIVARIDAKISSEIPLPIPRFVINSPIHMSSVVPAVSVTMISTSRPVLAWSTPSFLNRNA
jgi:hypothetical protein